MLPGWPPGHRGREHGLVNANGDLQGWMLPDCRRPGSRSSCSLVIDYSVFRDRFGIADNLAMELKEAFPRLVPFSSVLIRTFSERSSALYLQAPGFFIRLFAG
jgi:hypothetical protein